MTDLDMARLKIIEDQVNSLQIALNKLQQKEKTAYYMSQSEDILLSLTTRVGVLERLTKLLEGVH